MEEVKRKHKRFGKDFKISAVKMVTEGGHKASEVARSLDITPICFIAGSVNMPMSRRRPSPARAISRNSLRFAENCAKFRWSATY